MNDGRGALLNSRYCSAYKASIMVYPRHLQETMHKFQVGQWAVVTEIIYCHILSQRILFHVGTKVSHCSMSNLYC